MAFVLQLCISNFVKVLFVFREITWYIYEPGQKFLDVLYIGL